MAFLRAITNKTLVSKTKNKKLITCPAHKRARCNFFTLCFRRIRSRVTHSDTHIWTHIQKYIQLFILSHRSTSFLFLQYFLYLFYVLEPPWSWPNNGAFVYSVTYRDTLNGYGCVSLCVCVWVGVSVFAVVLVCMHKWATAPCVFAAHYWNSKLCMARYSCCCCCCGCCLSKTNAHKFTISA